MEQLGPVQEHVQISLHTTTQTETPFTYYIGGRKARIRVLPKNLMTKTRTTATRYLSRAPLFRGITKRSYVIQKPSSSAQLLHKLLRRSWNRPLFGIGAS